ncbi:MAG: 30S ribosomal protein S4 [Patescibacteria group bacterium]
MLRPKRFKIGRRLGPAVFDQTQTDRFAMSEARKKNAAKKDKHKKNISAFNLALREKQRVRLYYGMTERQFAAYVKHATELKGNPVSHLYTRLESRLDNIAYRAGLAPTHRAARQMVAHGHLLVNGKRIRVPSHQVSVEDVVGIRGGSSGKPLFMLGAEKLKEHQSPAWIAFDEKKGGWRVGGQPNLDEATSAFNFRSVIEYYSR